MSLYVFISHTYTDNLVWKSYKVLSWGYLTATWTRGGIQVKCTGMKNRKQLGGLQSRKENSQRREEGIVDHLLLGEELLCCWSGEPWGGISFPIPTYRPITPVSACPYLGCLFLLFSRSVMSDSLWPHGLQLAKLPCPSVSPKELALTHVHWVDDACGDICTSWLRSCAGGHWLCGA